MIEKMNKIKEIRTYLKLSQTQFGKYFGIPLRSVQNWESEQSSPPSYVVDMIQRIIELEEEMSGFIKIKNICDFTNATLFYKLTKTNTGILLCGDGRSLQEIANESIDCIITDHPWLDDKAQKSGTRNFADYDKFEYSLEDFKAKARVLKDGCFMAEFLPQRSASNKNYLNQIETMAESCGIIVYAYIDWNYSDSIYTGRTKKGSQQIAIFSKGNPRKLSANNVAGYKTKNILSDIDIPIQQKRKHHQAEKPIEVYEYLINNLTMEGETILDQFGGSCNAIQAALNTNRNAVVFEINDKYVNKAIKRFEMKKY